MNRMCLSGGSRWRLGVLALAVAAVLALAVPACAFATMPPMDVSKPATITGYVKDDTNTGIAGIKVSIHGDTDSSTMPQFSQSAITDATGKFVITDVIQGTYSMAINEPYEDEYQQNYAWLYPWHDQWFSETAVDTRWFIGGMWDIDAGTFVLDDAATYNGRAVKGITGTADVPVRASVANADGVVYSIDTYTGADGRVHIKGPAGNWKVSFYGKNPDVPVNPTPASWYTDGDPVCRSISTNYPLLAGQSGK